LEKEGSKVWGRQSPGGYPKNKTAPCKERTGSWGGFITEKKGILTMPEDRRRSSRKRTTAQQKKKKRGPGSRKKKHNLKKSPEQKWAKPPPKRKARSRIKKLGTE